MAVVLGDLAVQAPVIEPVDVAEGSELDVVKVKGTIISIERLDPG